MTLTETNGKKSVLVLGGGVAGLQAANDLAGLGFHVYLVERSPSLGGRMAQLDKTFPTNDCSMCILAPKMIECVSHPNITLLTCAELESLSGKIRDFTATVRKRTRYIDEKKCTGCGDCATVCPVELPGEFEMNLTNRKAIYKPFPQAVPNVFSISKRGISPCKDGCPAQLSVQAYVQLIKLGKFDEALAVIHETMPFAGTLGRICPRPCEDVCMRRDKEEPIAIAALKRAAADLGTHIPKITADETQCQQRAGKPVAIIGAGPAGLTAAYNLARKGYPVTVFEKLPEAGGMLCVGVPDYRLPRKVLDEEINIVRNLGVKIKTSSPIEGPEGIRDLFKNGFKAVFIATGAHQSMKLNVPGEDLDGVNHAVDLLREVSLGQEVVVGKLAVVVGGGNAAIDASRTLLRLGAHQVVILYRRTRKEMPAYRFEVDAALEENVRIEFLAAPVRIMGKAGHVSGIEAIRMRLGEPDSSGRRRPIPIEGAEFQIECDMVVPAIGQSPKLDFLGTRSGLKTTQWGTIIIDNETCATNLKGVFAGGDVVTGPATAVDAIAAANRAAEAIHHYLKQNHKLQNTNYKQITNHNVQNYKQKNNEKLLQGVQGDGFLEKSPPGRRRQAVVQLESKELERIERVPRTPMPELPVQERVRSFREVERGFDREAAVREAERCLNCAGCSDCMECKRACQADAVNHSLEDEVLSLRVGAVVVATGFNPMDVSIIEEYGGGRFANVVSGLEFERFLSPSGPTGGHVLRPSDGRAPKKIAFIQCVGSRDVRYHAYCSAVCCMHATKEAILANEHDKEVSTTIFYTELRAAGKTFQEFVARARNEYNVSYIRSRPAFLEEDEESKDVRVIYEDTNTRERKSAAFDMVVLCQALVPAAAIDLAKSLGVELNAQGFINTADALTSPIDTTRPGVLAVGFTSGPQDIPDSVVQASAAAGRVAELLKE
ncbi:MAG: FAD-dependent oxidoreductase [Candidatus Aminicenantes bacterium]|nr:MAG: FAD-dependent oxidoreductase [Candidatus Aminicenantes bacterium]